MILKCRAVNNSIRLNFNSLQIYFCWLLIQEAVVMWQKFGHIRSLTRSVEKWVKGLQLRNEFFQGANQSIGVWDLQMERYGTENTSSL